MAQFQEKGEHLISSVSEICAVHKYTVHTFTDAFFRISKSRHEAKPLATLFRILYHP